MEESVCGVCRGSALHVTNQGQSRRLMSLFSGWSTRATAWTESSIPSSHTSTDSPRRSAAPATCSSEGAFLTKSAQTNQIFKRMNPPWCFLPPRWVTTGDRFAPSDPCLFCDKCFRMLHYDAEGKKLGEFQAFPFVDRGAFN